MVSTDLDHDPFVGFDDDPFVVLDGIEHYRIDDVDRMEPFLTTVVSDADLWMFVSSAGSLTAGRIDATHAAFPYLPDDMIHRGSGWVGPVTVLARTVDGRREIWRPFHEIHLPHGRRSLAKSLLGDRLVAEETNEVWRVRVRATWEPSPSFGWVRTIEIIDEGDGGEFEVLDGLLDVMPPGVDPAVEQGSSNLVNAYKRGELVGAPEGLAVYSLESLITDRAEPGESLTSTVVWSWGLDDALVDLEARTLRGFLRDEVEPPRDRVTGREGAYLLRSTLSLGAGETARWSTVVDTGLDHVALTARRAAIARPDVAARVRADVAAGSDRLRALLAGADGLQSTDDRVADAHHLSNVLFNCMRGGVFPYGYEIPIADFTDFLTVRNRAVAERHGDALAELGDRVEVVALRRHVETVGDADLVRLVLEYLPLTFSRRHGDPSRPWNQFSIHVANDDGSEILRYEGNWRDIFQNWEALLVSYPEYFSHVVAKFVNASTLDGYNPYRISREGVDWEVPEPANPWGNLGYWGDHQIVYLLRLLEGWERFEPDAIDAWFDRPVFVYADVPYRISDRADMIRDPRSTITFLEDRAAAVAQREAELGTDGRLVVDHAGELLRVGFAEKLLVPALSKMGNLVPGGGIWMNTQRPEWNDANNALAGPGVSMVTVFHLHRYLGFLRDRFAAHDHVRLSPAVASWLADLREVCRDHRPPVVDDDQARRAMVDALGVVADAQGRRLLAGVRADATKVACADVVAFIDDALAHLAATIEVARRADGLVDSYNLVSFPGDDTASVERLGPMLEGQVAALSSGMLSPEDALALLDALYESGIYRADLDTFMLYPARELPAFTDRNQVSADGLPSDAVAALPSILAEDDDGAVRFRTCAINAEALTALLDLEGAPSDLRASVLDAYEATFEHASFTGRSGSMHGYEGIGSVYWHMVSKLLLATQEHYWDALDGGASTATLDGLVTAYRRIRAGLGFAKRATEFGAFPIDCYSHTPAHSGAQQPGMTGQVKEEVLTRLGEFGLRVIDARIRLEPGLLPDRDLFGVDGDGTATFTFCAVPMSIHAGVDDGVLVEWSDGTRDEVAGRALDQSTSAAITDRSGRVAAVRWTVAR